MHELPELTAAVSWMPCPVLPPPGARMQIVRKSGRRSKWSVSHFPASVSCMAPQFIHATISIAFVIICMLACEIAVRSARDGRRIRRRP